MTGSPSTQPSGSHAASAFLTYRDVPARIDYTILMNSRWETQQVHVKLSAGRRQQVVTLDHSDEGWVVDGNLQPELDPCDDVDLGWTPATNMIPLRRVAVDGGRSRRSTPSCTVSAEEHAECVDGSEFSGGRLGASPDSIRAAGCRDEG